MNERLAWAQWWSLPWLTAHPEWGSFDNQAAHKALYRCRHQLVSSSLGITPCLAPVPSAPELRFALATIEQNELMLALVDTTCRPTRERRLSEDQHLWCMRLSKALHPDDLLTHDDDPLRLLRAWAGPALWQRLRLRFARQRVLNLQKKTELLEAHARLDTLWQAVVWRVTALSNDEVINDVMSTHD